VRLGHQRAALSTEIVGRMRQAFDEMRAASYQGSDQDSIATVVVDGSGLVRQVELTRTVMRHGPDEVAAAVLAGYEQAERQRLAAAQELVARVRSMRQGAR
jgi:DNA-binding protein YbaB